MTTSPIVPGEAATAASVLGRAAANTRIEDAPPDVQERVLDIFVDMLGVFALGSGRAELVRLREMMASAPGGATVVGSALPTSANIAALLNGMTPSVYQIDEGHRRSRGHPGIHIVPVVFALAEERGTDVGAMFSALLAGYEVAVRLGKSLGPLKPTIHPHGNWGTIGAAAAAAHLLSHGDEHVIASAIDEAAAVTLYPDRAATTYGGGVHHLYVALGAHIGMTSAYAALCGISSVPGCLENFFGPSSGTDFDPQILLSGIDPATGSWSQYEVLNNYFKFYAACAHTHTALESIVSLMRQHRIDPEAIDRIDVRAFRAAANLHLQEVNNDLAARYNIPFPVAAALVQGEFTPDSLDDEVLTDPTVRNLAKKVFVQHDPALDPGYPSGRPIIMTVQLKNGTILEQEWRTPHGDIENPATREELHEKARGLLTHRFGREHADRILVAALGLGRGSDLATVSRTLREAAVTK